MQHPLICDDTTPYGVTCIQTGTQTEGGGREVDANKHRSQRKINQNKQSVWGILLWFAGRNSRAASWA